MLAQAIGAFARGGPGGNGENGGGAYGPERPYSYQDFLGTHPSTFTPIAEPLDAEHWLRILEQKFQLLNVTDEQKVRFVGQQLLGSASAWWDTFNAMQPMDHHVTWREFTTAFRQYYILAGLLNRKEVVRVSRAEARKHDCDGVCEQVQPYCTVCWDLCGY